jgi:hypothetical protein
VYDSPGPGRCPLWSGVHPGSGEQLLALDRSELTDAGYEDPTLLGYLEKGTSPGIALNDRQRDSEGRRPSRRLWSPFTR